MSLKVLYFLMNIDLQPLAETLRPQSLEDFVGQSHLLGQNKPLAVAFATGILHSMILWGPPGTGKTTLARLLTQHSHAQFLTLSAVTSGVKDIRDVVKQAQHYAKETGKASVLFVDEVHRFNKSQQDAFLPYVEDGTLIFIGATTENPSFELNNALLSRAKVYTLNALTNPQIVSILQRALRQYNSAHPQDAQLSCEDQYLQQLAILADGDARQAINSFALLITRCLANTPPYEVTETLFSDVLTDNIRRFDKNGDTFYDLISALHKSVRGSAPDAALYWLARMLDGGCDPLYIARRVVRMASEDIGNADPRALALALNAWDVQQRLGSPEGELAIAQAVVYLACAAKSNAVYLAFKQAQKAVTTHGTLPVPLHLRQAPTSLMKTMGYGKHYRYAHDELNAYAAGEHYFPDGYDEQYYYPVDRGLEIKIKQKLQTLKKIDKTHIQNKQKQED